MGSGEMVLVGEDHSRICGRDYGCVEGVKELQ